MPKIVNNIDTEFYIGTVYSYNISTRELEVFIPKLMPAIPEDGQTTTGMTNLGNSSVNISYNKQVSTKCTLTVRAMDFEEPLPAIGSKVLVWFLDGNVRNPFWVKFNVKNDFEVIPEEKYPRSFYITVGDKAVAVNKDDTIAVELPEGYSVVQLQNGKTKTFKIMLESDIDERLSVLEDTIGTPAHTESQMTSAGKTKYTDVPASGLYAIITNLNARIAYLESLLPNETSSSENSDTTDTE